MVTDTMGSPLPHVNIILVGTNLGVASREDGSYEIGNLSQGTYTVEFSAIGFKTYKKDNIVITDKSITVDVVLKEEIIEAEEIIVTVGKYEQKISDLPVSASIIPGTKFIKEGYFSLDYALRYVPGINLAEDQISIRGSSGYSKGAGTRVLVTMDGVPLYTGDTGEIIWEQIPLTDIERIEIIKGPASSLYGSTAIGGVINIITKKSVQSSFTQFQSYIGVYDNPAHKEWKWSDHYRTFYSLSLTHSNSINAFGYTLSMKKLIDDSYRKDDFKKRLIGYVKLNYDFSDFSSVSMVGNYLHMKRGNFLYWKNSWNVLLQKEEDQNKTVESDRLFLSLIYKQKLSNKISAELKSSYYYTNFKGIGVEVTTSKADLLRNELLMNFGFSENLRLISGVELSYAKVNSNIFSSPNFFTAAGYFQTEYRGIAKLIATVGLRYDHIKLDTLLGANAYTPKLGLNYKMYDDLTLRASFGTGFRAPTPAEVFTTSDVGMGISVKENLDLKAETSISFETGLQYTPSKILNFDLALFHTLYDNFIEPTLTAEGDIQFVNLVEAKIQGFELITDISLAAYDLKFSIGYTFLRAWNIRENKPMNYRPKHLLYFNAVYKPLPFEYSLDFRYWSKIEGIDMELVELGLIPDGELVVSVFVVDLNAAYNFSFGVYPISIFLNARNILNYNYVEFIGNLRPIRNLSLGINLSI